MLIYFRSVFENWSAGEDEGGCDWNETGFGELTEIIIDDGP